jgi:hypothetical protein
MKTRRTRRTAAGLLVVLAVAVAACSDQQELADITTIAPPVTGASVTTTQAAPTTAAPGTTDDSDDTDGTDTSVADTSPATSAPVATDAGTSPTGPMFSDALGVKVDTAPGVNTPGDTRQLLPEGLYVHIAWQADPNDPSVFTAREEDIDILEAYANAATAYYRVAGTTLDTTDAALVTNYVDPTDMFGASFEQARAGGYVLKIGTGVLLRPYIVDRTETTATIYDCFLEDSRYVTSDEQLPPGELVADGQVLTLIREGSRWLVDTAGVLERACA